MLSCSIVAAGLLGLASAQFPPKPEGVTLLKSKFHDNVTISFKEPGICETTPGVKSYSGYVHLPAGFLDDGKYGYTQDYPINTFFWFFEARKSPENAPLAIWLNGGPGSSSMMGLLEEAGPCSIAEDSKTTVLNPWSWNNEVNMLFIDQPAQVGFSYDVATNGTRYSTGSMLDFETISSDFSTGVPSANLTTRPGTFGSLKGSQTANSTAHAAYALWHFAQAWFTEFPHYKPIDDRISIWAESYGGHYGPGFARFFQEQNEKIAKGNPEETGAHYIHLDTLGIVNGLMDMVIQGEAYIQFPYQNTYGLQIFNQSIYEELMYNWTKPNGCRDRIAACQDALKDLDPVFVSANRERWADVCDGVVQQCSEAATSIFQRDQDGAAWLDMAHPLHDPFPAPTLWGYLTEESVLAALGVPVNYTDSSSAVASSFYKTFDIIHGGFREAMGYLLDSGIKVHMMYGDRDYACNWIGGENASLAVPYSRIDDFRHAGYAPLITPDGWSGMTRQFGNFSFSRVFQAGHEVPSYQPATAYEIFMRATFNRDIATGLLPVHDELSTVGPKDTWHIKNEQPKKPEPRCYVLKPGTCVPEVWEKVKAGKVVVKDYYVVEILDDGEETTTPLLPTDKSQQVIDEL